MNYPSIRIEGAILSPDIIDRLEDMPGQKPADFGLDSGGKVKDEIAAAWADAQDYWRIFQRKIDTLKPDVTATTETRNLWIVPLLRLLGYDLEFQKAGAEINGKTYAISHRITNRGNTPVHIVGLRDPAGLDRKPANATLRMSAHAVVQEFLNLDEQLYGLVTNGRMLRLLRDSSRLIKQSYLEFDLDRIFTDGLFADFAILYRLLHATRLPLSSEAAAESLIERYHQDSLDSGARIREGLSAAVENAILTFGNGFLAHPANDTLRQRLTSGTLTADDYYKSLLRLIYRLLFLMVIEERGLVFPDATTKRQRDTYMRFYSVQRLRNLSEKRSLADKRQNDLWLALLSTFRLFEAGGPGEKLGLKPLDGDLFRTEALGDLETSQLGNDALLTCLRSLGLYQHPTSKQLIRVNYAALNVEEFGSVYEGLLEYEPAIDAVSGPIPTFAFKRGDERSATGSHYTPDDLVQPLIKHSLDHLIADRLKKPDPEKELLDLRVADIACGSGHILLAAARRIATELAIARTGEEQPSPTAFRTALRDTIRSCIYGVDLNPLAVELCKVALWLEAHNPGEPLNFLDHRIKCGNAIVGYVRREEVDAGVPDEAFAKLPGDDPEVAKKIRARNKSERKSRDQKKFAFTKDRQGQIDAVLDKWKTIAAMPERVPADIDAKKDAFNAFMSSGAAFVLKQIASIPIAQFYLPRTEENEPKLITDEAFRDYWSGNLSPQGQAPAAAVGVATKKRLFHWFLEFPEIIQRGGFDCILGNPPYLGGQALSGTYGHELCNYVKHAYAPTGLSELVVFFLRRIFTLLRPGGFTAFITTNSIKDGDIRKDGLEQVVTQGGSINFAVRGVKWPGRANLVVSLVGLHKGRWTGDHVLDSKRVAVINPFLDDSDSAEDPKALAENKAKVFQGSIFLGDGFLLTHAEADSFRRENARNSEVLFMLLNGQELNNEPHQIPTRSIVNFVDRDEAAAKTYRGPFARIEELVKPVRANDKRAARRDRWWQYAERAAGLYAGIQRYSQCFAAAATTKYLSFSSNPTDRVFANTIYVFTTDRWDHFAVVQSTLHEVWARKYSGALKQDLRYSPSKCFDTFAFPEALWQTPSAGLAEIGERYHEHRRKLMLSLWLGLTDVYNLFHSREVEADLKKHFASRAKKDPRGESIPEEHRAGALSFTPEQALAGILELRRLHVELDTAVRDAYGWQDLPLEHDFYEVETLPENDRVRYTISPAARKDLLQRLLAENHRRAAAESAAAALTPPSTNKSGKRAKRSSDSDSPGLFGDGV
jgi:type I restriction-modification system DNA methylase subunit